ncbi:hypothetical protein M422DRAFT_260730 [Sphaerobolus stellatus SS14]|uniref:Unplaced genomic scaffold SPHSTscaffold_99, whole genome shotgun sequence n=1 Tax=Sphaerobolus stellatus (strain SS14) TaxID=990650 RepID=A0A0C9U260_SPHS4|nr:hypothetical protein M422DRAFT_260730 [Sphaerobolus stellatus SS14]
MPQQPIGRIPTLTEALVHKSKITDKQKATDFLEKERRGIMEEQTNLARNLLKDCQILINKHPEDNEFTLYNLDKDIVLWKANIAVELMAVNDKYIVKVEVNILDRTFKSVQKLNNGSIILESHMQWMAEAIKARKAAFTMKQEKELS